MRPNGRNKGTTTRKGFSILELLIAIIIIGILAAILIPVISTRTEKARIARAESDIERIADSLDRVQIDTGYYTRMFMLNDAIGGDGFAFDRGQNTNDIDDGVRDYNAGGGYFQATDRLFIDPQTGDLVSATTGAELYSRLTQNETEFNWNGPYVSWQKDRNDYGDAVGLAPDGLPDDPWGSNYLLFTRVGVVVEPTGLVDPGIVTLPQGVTITGKSFDRMTVLSLGPNAVPGDGSGTTGEGRLGRGDDIIRSFGR